MDTTRSFDSLLVILIRFPFTFCFWSSEITARTSKQMYIYRWKCIYRCFVDVFWENLDWYSFQVALYRLKYARRCIVRILYEFCISVILKEVRCLKMYSRKFSKIQRKQLKWGRSDHNEEFLMIMHPKKINRIFWKEIRESFEFRILATKIWKKNPCWRIFDLDS